MDQVAHFRSSRLLSTHTQQERYCKRNNKLVIYMYLHMFALDNLEF